ncbi:MAG: hypothetical protein AAGF92_09835 [Myxococcota bacterium]
MLTPEATIDAIAYLIANPVEASAVRYAKDWPGAHTLPKDLGTRVVRVRRPSHFFDPDTRTWPETLELRLELPTELEVDYGGPLTRRRVAERVRIRERRAWQESKRTGIAFVGSRRVLELAHAKRRASTKVFRSLIVNVGQSFRTTRPSREEHGERAD